MSILSRLPWQCLLSLIVVVSRRVSPSFCDAFVVRSISPSPRHPFVVATTTPRSTPSPATVAGSPLLATTTSVGGNKRRKKSGKPSMKERRKKRGRRLPPRPVDRPAALDATPPIDSWTTAAPTAATEAAEEADSVQRHGGADEEASAKASALIEAQRKSVDTLTYVRKRIEESLDLDRVVASLKERGYAVCDGLLHGGDESDVASTLVSEVEDELQSMLRTSKFDLDVSSLAHGGGEYLTPIIGGQDRYADCPRTTEFVVSLTRHLPPMLNDREALEDGEALDEMASAASWRAFDRTARTETLSLIGGLAEEEEAALTEERSFGYATDGTDGGGGEDSRRITCLYYVTPKRWDASCGGGITVRPDRGEEDGELNDVSIEAKRDRLVLLKSGTCLHRRDAWVGKEEDGLDIGGCVMVHLVKKA